MSGKTDMRTAAEIAASMEFQTLGQPPKTSSEMKPHSDTGGTHGPRDKEVPPSGFWERLTAPFPPADVMWRVGATTKDGKKGMALAYIDARMVMDRLDDVCGPGGWQCRYPWDSEGLVCCEIGIRSLMSPDPDVEDGLPYWTFLWKADGAGKTDYEGQKGSMSSAFKRAAVRWGIGRYLYDLPSPWMPINDRKQFTDDSLNKLRIALERWGK